MYPLLCIWTSFLECRHPKISILLGINYAVFIHNFTWVWQHLNAFLYVCDNDWFESTMYKLTCAWPMSKSLLFSQCRVQGTFLVVLWAMTSQRTTCLNYASSRWCPWTQSLLWSDLSHLLVLLDKPASLFLPVCTEIGIISCCC